MTNEKNKLFNELSGKLGLSADGIKNAAERGDVDGVLKNADPKQAEEVRSILKDPEKTKQLLNSPQAQAIIKLLNKK